MVIEQIDVKANELIEAVESFATFQPSLAQVKALLAYASILIRHESIARHRAVGRQLRNAEAKLQRRLMALERAARKPRPLPPLQPITTIDPRLLAAQQALKVAIVAPPSRVAQRMKAQFPQVAAPAPIHTTDVETLAAFARLKKAKR